MMRILPVELIKPQMILGQNIFRHDGLLSLPKGARVGKTEIDLLKDQQLDYILMLEPTMVLFKEQDIHLTLSIIEAAFTTNTLWESKYGEALYDYLERRIAKNKKIQLYLSQLRELDSYSFVHCINISILVTDLLKNTDMPFQEVANIAFLVLLHDVGRIKLGEIFNKKDALTKSEFDKLKTHPIISYKMLKKAGIPEKELHFILEHHEKYDGSGYPYRLKGEEISDLAQLVLIADYYNALLSYRPHRNAFSPFEVVEMMNDEKNKAFGEHYIRFFQEKFVPYRIGCSVELSDGSTATIKGFHPYQKTLPIVDIYSNDMSRPVTIDLFLHRNLTIKRIVQEF